jgi:hypothetical protein
MSGTNTGIRVGFDGSHDTFPGYEGIAVIGGNRYVVYSYMPEDEGPTPLNLTSEVSIGQKSDAWFDISPIPENCEWNAGSIRSLYSL